MTRESFPANIGDLTDAWLTLAMRRAGALGDEERVTITSATPLVDGTAFSTLMYRVGLSGPAGVPTSVVVKLPVSSDVRAVLDAVGAYAREVTFYRNLATGVPVRVPRPIVAEQATDGTDFVLVLEDLAPLRSADQLAGLTVAQVEVAMEHLARFHAWSWEHDRLASYGDRFPPIDGSTGRAVLAQFGQHFGYSWAAAKRIAGDGMAPEVQAFGDGLPALIPFFVEQLARPRTLVHGELRADNMFFDEQGTPILIDFQAVQQEAGVRDVAYLVSQSMTVLDRRGQDERLVRRYWEGLQARGISGYPWSRCWEQYRLGVAYSLVFPGMAVAGWDVAGARGQALVRAMLSRASAAIMDNDSLQLVPVGTV